ncbi:unnamed protein product [Adineta steineri]|uniref:Uncharacterized protein n=1 Tax=Adineta steineri TaxID=433720 RepID=A0A815C3A7_9BILA|nr:unnamed protein product [Adineta steineri]
MLTKHYFHIISISKNVSNNIHVGLPPNYSAHQHVCITLFWTNRLRCFQFPLSIINAVRDAINASWTSNDFCRLLDDNNSFIFELGVRPSPTLFFAISRYDLDKLQVICAPPDVIQRIRQTFGENNIQREEWLNDARTCYRLKLSGKPWTNDETVSSRIRLLSLLDCFTSLDCQLHTGICMNGVIDSAEADTWIFRRKIQ